MIKLRNNGLLSTSVFKGSIADTIRFSNDEIDFTNDLSIGHFTSLRLSNNYYRLSNGGLFL